LFRAYDVDVRPARAGSNSSPDIFGPRLTACRRSVRKERACRLDKARAAIAGVGLVLRRTYVRLWRARRPRFSRSHKIAEEIGLRPNPRRTEAVASANGGAGLLIV
jgi:hypothetical protein